MSDAAVLERYPKAMASMLEVLGSCKRVEASAEALAKEARSVRVLMSRKTSEDDDEPRVRHA